MTSNDDDQSKRLIDWLSRIAADAEETSKNEHSTASDTLLDRLDALEVVIEEVRRRKKLDDSLADYISDLRQEMQEIKLIRRWSISLSVFVSLILLVTAVYCATATPIWFLNVPSYLQAPFLASLIIGAVLLLSLIVRGAFRGRADRNKDDLLPPNVKELFEMTKNNEQK
ncbi:MAG: hypothetical protein AAFY02_07685 [Pseudomonadota bacterium]